MSRPLDYIQSVEELNAGLQKLTNPFNGREKDLNLGPPDFKSSALTTTPRLPPLSLERSGALLWTHLQKLQYA